LERQKKGGTLKMIRIICQSGRIAASFTIYRKGNTRIGERVQVTDQAGNVLAHGRVARHMADDQKYQNQYAHGINTPVNTGKDYYQIQID
jgi:hypothetical protein